MNSKWVIGLLIVSLGLNLATIGYLIGRETSPVPLFDPARMYPIWARQLPEERRQALSHIFREHRQTMRPNVRDMRRQYREMRQAIVAEPFDRERLAQALAHTRQGLMDSQARSHRSFISFIEALTLEERQHLARDLARRGKPFRPPRRAEPPN